MSTLPSSSPAPAARIGASPLPWAAAVWLGIGLFSATQNIFLMRSQGMHHAWVKLFFFLILCWLPWALATPALLQAGQRMPPRRAQTWRYWSRHLIACLLIGMSAAVWKATLENFLDPWIEPPVPWTVLWSQHALGSLVSDVVIYCTVLAVGHGLGSRERLIRQQTESARLNEQLARAQLDALRRQIEPHFLFNTLNAITGLVRDQRNDAAVGMIAGLSELLRRMLDDSERHFIPLGEELAFLDKYFAIQQMRFGDRLRYSVDADPALLAARVPGLILQPVVENAFKHGLAHRADGGAIRLRAAAADGVLILTIYNDGPVLPFDATQGESGIGLANVRERLKACYDERYTLAMHNRDQGVEVRITLPLTDSER